MRKLVALVAIAAIAGIGMIGCEKEKVDPPPTVSMLSSDYGQAGDTILITGENFGDDFTNVKVLFGNDKLAKIVSVFDTKLTVVAPAESTSAPISITVGDQTVLTAKFSFFYLYTYGATKATSLYLAAYWKDSKIVLLSQTYSEILEMVVVGTDVHAIGYDYPSGIANNSQQMYWKNGVSVPIANLTPTTRFTGIAVAGSDVYISGVDLKQGTKGIAKYWKNGQEVILGDNENSWTSDIQVFGTDVYVTGHIYPKAVYWKNRVVTELAGIGAVGYALATTMVDGNIYMAGSDNWNGYSTAIVWKNGTATKLTEPLINNYNSAYTVFVSGSDVYAGGKIDINNGNSSKAAARYWKNGVAKTFDERTYYPPLEIRCISEYKGDIFMTMATNSFNSYALILRNDEVYVPSEEYHRKMLGHQIVEY